MVRGIVMKQKGIWKNVIIGGAVLLAMVITAGSFFIRKSRVKGEQGAVCREAVVEKGTIATSVSGTGTLSYADSTEIILPSDLLIDKMLVDEGSYVEEGELLATVEEASLAVCFNEVEEAISELDATITAEQSSSTNQSIKAGVSGRVKKIYAVEEDDIVNVMKEQGALMLLSADGFMAVKLELGEKMNPGDEVTVSSSNAEITGTIETADSETAVIIFDDSVFDYEEEVTVTSADGVELGKGSAYIHQMIKIVGVSGTISSLNVSQNSTVSAATKVYTLDSQGKMASYLQAVQEREQLVSLLDMLISIQANGGITATAEGMIESVSVSASAVTENIGVQTGETIGENKREEEEKTLVSGQSEDSGFAMMSAVEPITRSGSASQIKETPEAPQNLVGGEGVITGTTTAMEYADSENAVVWTTCNEGNTKAAAGIWYVRFKETEDTCASLAAKVEVTQTTRTEAITDSTEGTNGDNISDGTITEKDASVPSGTNSTESGDGKSGSTGTDRDTEGKNSSQGSVSSSASGGKSASANSSGTASVSLTGSTSSLVDTVSGFVIAKGDKMIVTMNVDELDILSIKKGLLAEVSLDAVENEVFSGEIMRVSGNASASGGVAQYPVEIVLDKTEDMLSGMNASIEIIIEQAEDVLVVPLAAVTDEGEKSYVYTGYDESKEELTGKVEVTLGRSDGRNVEIQSGLSEGDSIYYQVMGSEESSKNEGDRMKGTGMPDGMEGMPSDKPDMKQNGDWQGGGQQERGPRGGMGGL